MGKVNLNNMKALEREEAIRCKTKQVALSFIMRLSGLAIAFTALLLMNTLKEAKIDPAAEIIILAWAVTCSAYLVLFRLNIFKGFAAVEAAHLSYYPFAMIYAASEIHFLGGAESMAFFIYFFEIIYANLLLSRRKGFFISILMGMSYFTLVLLEYKGVLPHYKIFSPGVPVYSDTHYLLAEKMTGTGLLFILMAYSINLFSRIWEERERTFSLSKRNMDERFKQMEEITLSLKKKIAENKYLKTVTLGYIEKKEYELEMIKKDLESQIEKLRKTQKSMFFMIEDLNQMSAEIKDAKEHLEEKVHKRTEELIKINQKLHRGERLAFLGKLAASVTHELRNPLAVLRNTAFFFRKKFKDIKDVKVLKYLETMEKEIGIINSIIDDIMGFAKTKPIEPEDADIKEVIREVISRIDLPEFIEVKKDFVTLPKIEMDVSQVIHALTNIINNAIIAMNGNGTLTLKTGRKGNHVFIEIGDTGPGIPPEKRELIFEPLYSSKSKGTGLGLALSKMMVENQEGWIEFESEVDIGTVFRVFLPLAKRSQEVKSG